MTNANPSRKLNNDQIEILELLLKFRFGTRQLIGDYFSNKPGMDVYRKLQVLEKRELIAKRFEPSYRLQAKPAAYYLLPAGARRLGKHRSTERPPNIKSIYKDKTVSEQFIQHCLDTFDIYGAFKMYYGNSLKFFTKSGLNYEDFEYFPQPLPTAYFRLENSQQYFLEIHQEGHPFFVLVRTIKKYMKYGESGEWEDTGTDLPVLLLVVENESIQKRICKFIDRHVDDLNVFVATKKTVLEKNGGQWLDPYDTDSTYALGQL